MRTETGGDWRKTRSREAYRLSLIADPTYGWETVTQSRLPWNFPWQSTLCHCFPAISWLLKTFLFLMNGNGVPKQCRYSAGVYSQRL